MSRKYTFLNRYGGHFDYINLKYIFYQVTAAWRLLNLGNTFLVFRFIYLEQVAWQNFQSLLRIFHAFQFRILVQHALEYIEEKLQRELVQEVDLEEENNERTLLDKARLNRSRPEKIEVLQANVGGVRARGKMFLNFTPFARVLLASSPRTSRLTFTAALV